MVPPRSRGRLRHGGRHGGRRAGRSVTSWQGPTHQVIPQVQVREPEGELPVTSVCPLWSHGRAHLMTIPRVHVYPCVPDVNRTSLFKNHRFCGHGCSQGYRPFLPILGCGKALIFVLQLCSSEPRYTFHEELASERHGLELCGSTDKRIFLDKYQTFSYHFNISFHPAYFKNTTHENHNTQTRVHRPRRSREDRRSQQQAPSSQGFRASEALCSHCAVWHP